MTKAATLNDIVKCCEIRFNRGNATTWTHRDFVDLHQQILRDTGVNISPSTLKRIFGKIAVDKDYIPQQATLDALKKYGNYTEPGNPQLLVSPAQDLAAQDLPNRASKVNRGKIVFLILIVSTVIAALLATQFWKSKNISGKINITRIEGQLPATAFFELQLPETEDSLFFNFGDKSPLTYIKPGSTQGAHIYYFPGFFTVSVQTRQQAIATTSAYIESGNWIAFGCHRQEDIPLRFYAFPPVKTSGDSVFQVTNMQLSKMGLDTTGPILTRLCNYTPVEHSGDEFIFETTFKNSLQESGIYCRGTQFQIAGSNSMIRFRLVSSGCSLRILHVLSEQTFKGATEDLSQFVIGLSQWNTVKLVNHNKQVSLYVNGRQIFAGAYQRSLGDIKGVFVEFEGTGSVKNCDLKSYQGKVLYAF